MDEIIAVQGKLIGEVEAEGAKYGDDVKYLADFTSGVKKFDPWIQKSEAKKAVGMTKPKDFKEAQDQLADAQVNHPEHPMYPMNPLYPMYTNSTWARDM